MEDDNRRQLAIPACVTFNGGDKGGYWSSSEILAENTALSHWLRGFHQRQSNEVIRRDIYSWRRGGGDSTGAEKSSECLDILWPGPGLGYTPDCGG